jgi:hypothetical protein
MISPRAAVPAGALEGDDEAQQVRHQRQHPEKRNRRDLLREVVRHREQQHHWSAREREPPRPLRRCLRLDARLDVTRDAPTARREPERPREKARAPQPALRAQRRHGLEHEGVGEQPDQRARVRHRVQPVHVHARVARGPRLQQRSRCREREVRQPDRECEREEEVRNRRFTRGRSQRQPGDHGRAPERRGSSQSAQREGDEPQLHLHLPPWRKASNETVRPRVTAEQQHLKEELTGGPDTGRAAKPWQQGPCDHRLHQKEQHRADGDREDRVRHSRWRAFESHVSRFGTLSHMETKRGIKRMM